jgi:hypothetical protein
MLDIETAQVDQKLVSLLLKVNGAASRRDLMGLRETAVALVMVLDNAGVRPATDDQEPLVSRSRVQEVGRRLREADQRSREQDEKVRVLEADVARLRSQVAEERRAREAGDLLADDSYEEEAHALMLRQLREELAPLIAMLEKGGEDAKRKVVEVLKRAEQRLGEAAREGPDDLA